ncbi:TPA: DUF1642 domain-containing protein [Enterococcus faecium]
MNKLEAINELESLKMIGNDARATCYNEGINAGITIIKQLDEPQKSVIQQFVADLVDWTNKMQCAPSDVIRDLHDNGDLANLPRDLELDKLSEYFEKAYCRYDFEKACFVGYEVEKEQLYRVVINNRYLAKMSNFSDVVILVSEDEISECATESYELTEKQIKAIDERYWAFAVPVEEVTEG